MDADKDVGAEATTEQDVVTLQQSLTEQLDIYDWVPSLAWTVDAIRIIHAVQVRGAVKCQFDDSVGSATLEVIKEVCDHQKWFFQLHDRLLWIVDFDDFEVV